CCFRSRGFWGASESIGEIPLATDEQVPQHWHENDARRGIDSSAHGTIQTREKDAFEYFFAADSFEIRPGIFAVEGTTKRAPPVNESAMMTQQVESKTDAGQTSAPRDSTVEE